MAAKTVMLIVFSQNGQRVFSQTNAELEAAGYRVTMLNDCLVRLEFGKLSQFISCNAPSVGIGSAYGKPMQQKTVVANPVPVKR